MTLSVDAVLHPHRRPQVHACRCTLTVQAPPGQRIDVVALQAALEAIPLPDGLRVVDANVCSGWQEEAPQP
jgi:hypothetical protein